MVNALINAVEDPSTSGGRTLIDNTVLINKVGVAKYFTEAPSMKEVDDAFINAARSYTVGGITTSDRDLGDATPFFKISQLFV